MAARNLDWAEFLDRHDQRYAALVRCAVTGQPANSLKGSLHVSDTTLSTFKRNLAADIRESMGEDVLKEVCRRPRWKGDLAVENEKAACRAERRHA